MEEVGTQYSVLSTQYSVLSSQFSVLSEKARPDGNGCDRFFSRSEDRCASALGQG